MNKRIAWMSITVLALALAPTAAVQESNESKPQEPSQAESKDNSKKSDEKDGKKKKKKEKSGGRDLLNTEVFSEAVANTVLRDVKDGLEGHSQRLMLSAFDPDKMDGYLAFEDQMEAFFQRYESFRVHYRIVQTTVEGPRAIVLVDVQMEVIPRGGAAPPSRRSEQLRLELERGRKGWKIVDFRPRGFFS